MSFDVIIIGAGAAGIAAGRCLKQQGLRPVLLEARGRVGGRAWTDTQALGVPLDMGCAWLHCAEQNPWAEYAVTHGFAVDRRTPDWGRRVGRNLLSPENAAARRAASERNFTLVDKAAAEGRDVPVSEIVPDDAYRPLFDAVMTWLVGIESDAVSTLDLSRYQDTEANWSVAPGLGSVVAHAAGDLDVRLNTPATQVTWSGQGVAVSTAAGVVEAQAAVVTVPTNVLAAEGIRFVPELPLVIQEALADVPLGIANKVFFEMEPGALPFEGTAHFHGTDRSAHTCTYAVRPGGQPALMAYFGGRFARELEQRGEMESFARDELKSIFGGEFTARIRRSASTAWSSDPWSMGSYSAARPGRALSRETLEQSIGEKIFLAGEACSVHYFGTVHGAWESGVRAARRAAARLRTAGRVD